MSNGDWDPFISPDMSLDAPNDHPLPEEALLHVQQILGGRVEQQERVLEAMSIEMAGNRNELSSFHSSIQQQMNTLLDNLQNHVQQGPARFQDRPLSDEEQERVRNQYATYPRRVGQPPIEQGAEEERQNLQNLHATHITRGDNNNPGKLIFRPQRAKIGANRYHDLPKARLYHHIIGETFCWPLWRVYYVVRAERMGWSHQEARENLPLYMGEATAFFTTADISTRQTEECWTLDDLLDKYEEKFNPTSGAEIAKAAFENSVQQKSEGLLQWHNRVKILYQQAHPGKRDEEILIRHFQRGILAKPVADWISDHSPTTYDYALKLACRKMGTLTQFNYKMFHQTPHGNTHGYAQGQSFSQQKRYRQPQPRSEPMEVNTMESRDHSKLICYACNRKGHIRPNCPSKERISSLIDSALPNSNAKRPFLRKKKIEHMYHQQQKLIQQLSQIEHSICQIEDSQREKETLENTEVDPHAIQELLEDEEDTEDEDEDEDPYF